MNTWKSLDRIESVSLTESATQRDSLRLWQMFNKQLSICLKEEPEWIYKERKPKTINDNNNNKFFYRNHNDVGFCFSSADRQYFFFFFVLFLSLNIHEI